MSEARVLGNNIRLLLNNNGIDKSTFADALGYSRLDVDKLCDARLFTTEDDIKDIADFFGIEPSDLLAWRDDAEYKGAGFLLCMGKFTRPENKEKILNIFDMYCDLKEALNK